LLCFPTIKLLRFRLHSCDGISFGYLNTKNRKGPRNAKDGRKVLTKNLCANSLLSASGVLILFSRLLLKETNLNHDYREFTPPFASPSRYTISTHFNLCHTWHKRKIFPPNFLCFFLGASAALRFKNYLAEKFKRTPGFLLQLLKKSFPLPLFQDTDRSRHVRSRSKELRQLPR
jgi:hypothetical protein